MTTITIPRALLEQWKQTVNTLAALSLKAERYEVGVKLKQSMADELERPTRCSLCGYQHGHQIGCANNPVDISLSEQADSAELAKPAAPAFIGAPTVLPDGSSYFTASYPLPKTHWLYAPMEYEPGSLDPIELPAPILKNAHIKEVIAAIRYAVRGVTMCGKELDFDPDALVQNAVYALCGPHVKAIAKAEGRTE